MVWNRQLPASWGQTRRRLREWLRRATTAQRRQGVRPNTTQVGYHVSQRFIRPLDRALYGPNALSLPPSVLRNWEEAKEVIRQFMTHECGDVIRAEQDAIAARVGGIARKRRMPRSLAVSVRNAFGVPTGEHEYPEHWIDMAGPELDAYLRRRTREHENDGVSLRKLQQGVALRDQYRASTVRVAILASGQTVEQFLLAL